MALNAQIKFRIFELFPAGIKAAISGLVFIVCFFCWYDTSSAQGLFDDDEVIELTLSGDLKTIFKDRGEDPQYHPASLSYQWDQGTLDIPINIKTRGHFRKMSGNCKYPPLLLNFETSPVPAGSVFSEQSKTKLVTPCRDDVYNVHEYLVYKLYNLVTPKSFRARLVKIIFDDTGNKKMTEPYFGVLIEEEEQMASRNGSISIEETGLRPEATQKDDFLRMAVFEYMIGNTDWSVQYLQNIKLITPDSSTLPSTVPYDFDHAGIVRAPYAKPAEALQMTSTLQRRYRGYCIPNMVQFAEVFDTFNRLRDDFYALYDGNEMLSSSYQKQTVKFLDQFFETINDPDKAQEEFTYPCDRSGTGNVVIQGLKKNE